MKQKIFILVLSIIFAPAVWAQDVKAEMQNVKDNSNNSFIDRMMLNLDFGTALYKQKERQVMSFGADLGFKITKKFYMFATAERMLALYDNPENSYLSTTNLGGGLGYTLGRVGYIDIDLYGKVGASVGHTDWKNVTYDARLMFRIKRCKLINVNVSIGYRHINSRTSGIDNYNGVFGTIGFGF